MAWHSCIYEYDGTLNGLFCCVFDSYTRRETPIAITTDQEQETFDSVHTVYTDTAHAARIRKSICARSEYAMDLVRRSFLTCLPQREMTIYRFIRRLYAVGPALLLDPTNDYVYPLIIALRHMSGELEKLRGFVRFSEFNGVYAAEIEPKNRVLPLLRGHFCARFSDQSFLIYDRTHREVLLSQNGQARIVPLESFEMARPDEREASFRRLWKTFYDTIAIDERRNPRCQRTQLPLRYRSTMTEFQGESYFSADPALSEHPRKPSLP